MEHFGNDNRWPQYLYDWHPVNIVNRNKAHTINHPLPRRAPAENNFTQNQALQRRQDSGSVISLISFSEVRKHFPRVTTWIAMENNVIFVTNTFSIYTLLSHYRVYWEWQVFWTLWILLDKRLPLKIFLTISCFYRPSLKIWRLKVRCVKSISMTAYVTNLIYIMRYHNSFYLHFNTPSHKSSFKGQRCRNSISQNI